MIMLADAENGPAYYKTVGKNMGTVYLKSKRSIRKKWKKTGLKARDLRNVLREALWVAEEYNLADDPKHGPYFEQVNKLFNIAGKLVGYEFKYRTEYRNCTIFLEKDGSVDSGFTD